jgi:hypothetical protein
MILRNDGLDGTGNYYCYYTKILAYQKDLSTAYFSGATRGYSSPKTITALQDYVYILVQGYFSFSYGTFAIKVTSS